MSLVMGRRVVADQGVGGRRDGCFQRDGFLDRGGSQGDGSPGDPRGVPDGGGCGTERWGRCVRGRARRAGVRVRTGEEWEKCGNRLRGSGAESEGGRFPRAWWWFQNAEYWYWGGGLNRFWNP